MKFDDLPTRSEEVVFFLNLDAEKARKHKQSAKIILGGDPTNVADGDTLKLTYTLSIQYWGDIVTRLKAIQRILEDPNVLVSVSTEELKHGRCLIQDVFTELAKVQEQIAARTT
jgi:hypothetical protein